MQRSNSRDRDQRTRYRNAATPSWSLGLFHPVFFSKGIIRQKGNVWSSPHSGMGALRGFLLVPKPIFLLGRFCSPWLVLSSELSLSGEQCLALAGPTASLITPEQTFGSSRADLNWLRQDSSPLGKVYLLEQREGHWRDRSSSCKSLDRSWEWRGKLELCCSVMSFFCSFPAKHGWIQPLVWWETPKASWFLP